jgi:hypothetical protein
MQTLQRLSFEARLKQARDGDWVRYYVPGPNAGWRGGTITRIVGEYVWLAPVLPPGTAQPVHFSHVCELQCGGEHYLRR